MAANRYRLDTAASDYPRRHSTRELKLLQTIRDDKNIIETFQSQPVVGGWNQATGLAVAAEPASALTLAMNTGKVMWEIYYAAIETTGTAVAQVPVVVAAGLQIPLDADVTDGPTAVELTHGTTARSRAKYTVGTDETFYMEATMTIADISDLTELWFGFRKAEAYQADADNYDELACVNVGLGADGRFNITKILNNAATSTTNTSVTAWADAGEHTLRVEVLKNGTCKFYIDGTESTVASHTFDAGEVVIPFIQATSETGDPTIVISNWEVGRQ